MVWPIISRVQKREVVMVGPQRKLSQTFRVKKPPEPWLYEQTETPAPVRSLQETSIRRPPAQSSVPERITQPGGRMFRAFLLVRQGHQGEFLRMRGSRLGMTKAGMLSRVFDIAIRTDHGTTSEPIPPNLLNRAPQEVKNAKL
jgi:hypothetical protein